MEQAQPLANTRQTDFVLALNALKGLGISNIIVVDDTNENLSAATSIKEVVEKSGLSFNTFSGVTDFKANLPSINKTAHTLILTDFQMPSTETFMGHENCGGIDVINAALLSESPGKMNFPIVISHGGKGHTGEIVHLCFGNDRKQTGDFSLGKADPAFWQAALKLIATELTTGEAKELWKVRTIVNESNPFTPSVLIEENMKLGYIPDSIYSAWRKEKEDAL